MTQIHGRLLTAVADYLGITGSQNVGDVDLSSLILTHDVQRALEEGLLRDLMYQRDRTIGAGTGDVWEASFWESSIWTTIRDGKRTLTSNSDLPPDDWEWLVVEFGSNVSSGAVADWDYTAIRRDLLNSRLVLWYADTATDQDDALPQLPIPLPWREERQSRRSSVLEAESVNGGAAAIDVSYLFRVLSAPPGLLPRY